MDMKQNTRLTDEQALTRLENLNPDDPSVKVRDRTAVRQIQEAVADRNDADLRIFKAVHKARDEGVTWVEVAQALGVTHQAAMKRYGKVNLADVEKRIAQAMRGAEAAERAVERAERAARAVDAAERAQRAAELMERNAGRG
jgi:hypothetical protein